MAPGPLLLLAAALALQPPETGSAGLERRTAVLIEQIENAAMAEPPVFGIDTQIRAGEVLKGHDDAHAARFLRDAGQGTLQLTDASTRAAFLKNIVMLLAPLDATHAESLCATQSRRAPGQTADPLAACYDQLIGGLKDWSQARDALDRALAAGAYNLTSTGHLLQQARESQPADFAPLLAQIVGAFPEQPEPDEVAQLETIAATWRRAAPALARQALARCRAARAALAERPSATAQAGAHNAAVEPGSPFTEPADEEPGGAKMKLDFKFDFDIDLGFGEQADDPGLKHLPETKDLPLDAALRLIRSQEYAGARAAMLGDLIDTRAGELDAPRWAALAQETIRESGHMKPSGDALVLLAELARLCFEHGERALAAQAAQLLAASFDTLVQCGDSSCAIFRIGGSPGTIIMFFAAYLKNNKIEPADLGLHHPDLDARWLVMELESLLNDNTEEKRPGGKEVKPS